MCSFLHSHNKGWETTASPSQNANIRICLTSDSRPCIYLDKVLILAGHPWTHFRSLSLWYSQQDKTALSTYVFNGWDILFPPLPTVETFSICLIVGRSQVAILGLTMKYLLSSNLPGAIWNPRAFGLYHFYKMGPEIDQVMRGGKRKVALIWRIGRPGGLGYQRPEDRKDNIWVFHSLL